MELERLITTNQNDLYREAFEHKELMMVQKIENKKIYIMDLK